MKTPIPRDISWDNNSPEGGVIIMYVVLVTRYGKNIYNGSVSK